jgi:hypothetical protein
MYLYIYIQHPSAIELAGAPPHVQNLLQAIHRDTWFVVDDQSDVVRTELGPRPGDGFADVVFGFLGSKLLRTLEAELQNLQMLDHFPIETGLQWGQREDLERMARESSPFLGPTWMDDLCDCLSAHSNDELVNRIGVAAGLLLDLCRAIKWSPS